MGVYISIYQIKQHMIMNIIFAVYFGVITVLNCFGDDQCLGMKLVLTRFIKFFNCCSNSCGCSMLSLYPETIVTVLRRFGLFCKTVKNCKSVLQTDHEALRRGRSELLILLELV